MRARKQIQIIACIILCVCLFLIWRLSTFPFQRKGLTHTIGQAFTEQADIYLNNVAKDAAVTLRVPEKEEEGEHIVYVTYQGREYPVTIQYQYPNIQDIVRVKQVDTFFIGDTYEKLFDILEPYKNQVTYSVKSTDLKEGTQQIVLSLYNQTITKEVTVTEATSEIEQLALAYDYVNTDLTSLVKQFLKDEQIEETQVAFVYKNTQTQQVHSLNEKQLMVAASTYKVPTVMLSMDKVKSGELSATQKYVVSSNTNDIPGEYSTFVRRYGGQAPLDILQSTSIISSSNVAGVTLLELLGGQSKAFSDMEKYGAGSADVRTIDGQTLDTTAEFFMNVLTYLWEHQEEYKSLLAYMEKSTPNEYYDRYLDVRLMHKYGSVRQAINDIAIVHEKVPYLIALYTDAKTDYQKGLTLKQFGKLAYIINTWHTCQ